MRERIRRWYEGEYKSHVNSEDSGLVRVRITGQPHWTAKAARWIVEFYLKHWKFVIGTTIALVGLVFSI